MSIKIECSSIIGGFRFWCACGTSRTLGSGWLWESILANLWASLVARCWRIQRGHHRRGNLGVLAVFRQCLLRWRLGNGHLLEERRVPCDRPLSVASSDHGTLPGCHRQGLGEIGGSEFVDLRLTHQHPITDLDVWHTRMTRAVCVRLHLTLLLGVSQSDLVVKVRIRSAEIFVLIRP